MIKEKNKGSINQFHFSLPFFQLELTFSCLGKIPTILILDSVLVTVSI